VTRIAIVDPHPAVRAGLTALLRAEPGLVPVGSAGTVEEALDLVARAAPDIVLLEPYLGVDDGLQLCRRITGDGGPRVVAYTEVGDPALEVALRVAGADGLVDKAAAPEELFEAIRVVARGDTALPPLEAHDLDAAAHRIDPEDLALLAMLVDGTPVVDAADTLRLDHRKVGRRIERMLGRLRARSPAAA
jgi:DNA-binding NarL/FixJ family response regulator